MVRLGRDEANLGASGHNDVTLSGLLSTAHDQLFSDGESEASHKSDSLLILSLSLLY